MLPPTLRVEDTWDIGRQQSALMCWVLVE